MRKMHNSNPRSAHPAASFILIASGLCTHGGCYNYAYLCKKNTMKIVKKYPKIRVQRTVTYLM